MSEIATQRESLHDRAVEHIKVLLLRRDMSGRELAARIGVKQAYLSRRMTGEVKLSLDEIEAISVALGVDAVDLLRPQDPLPPLEVEPEPRVIVRGGERRTRSGRRPNDRSLRPATSLPVATNGPGGVARTDKRQLVEARHGPKITSPTVRRPSRLTTLVADSVTVT
jgi:transcriptional regulator with XRE-family HTH domain